MALATLADNQRRLSDLKKLSSEQLRDELTQKVRERTGFTPRDFQLNAAVAKCHGKDVMVRAGTGFGKTLIMVMPCFLTTKITAVIVSPLIAIEDDQARKFRSWGFKVAVINAREMQDNEYLLSNVKKGLYQIVLTSPENALSATLLKPFLTRTDDNFDFYLEGDEIHLMRLWGTVFRQDFYRLGNLRSFVHDSVPFSGYSATLTDQATTDIKKILHMDPAKTVDINMGNFRKNIFWDVKPLSGAEAAIPEIGQYLPVVAADTTDIPLTLIFVNTIVHGCLVYDFLIRHYPSDFHPQIQLLHSFRSAVTKAHVMYRVMREKRGILVCTTIAALGCDFPRCRLVIQLFSPKNVDKCLQQGGRGGREEDTPCRSVVLPQPSALEPPKPSKSTTKQASVPAVVRSNDEPADSRDATDGEVNTTTGATDTGDADDTEDPVMWEFLTSDQCLWSIIDRHYNNPPHEESIVGCCYNCERRRNPPAPSESANETPQPIGISEGYEVRTTLWTALKAHIKTAIGGLREQVWRELYEHGDIMPEFLLPDKNIETIAKAHETIHTIEDLRNVESSWPLACNNGERLLEVICETRMEVEERWAEHARELADKQKKVEEARAERKAEQRKREEEERESKKRKRVEKKRAAVKEKWDEYVAKKARGEARGRPPKKPSPSPERG